MASRLPHQAVNVVLTSSISRNLRQGLAAYRNCAEASYAALLEESGTVLIDSGELEQDQSAIIGALANGAFIAVRELASRLGDDSCEGLYHQGRTKHFYIVPLSPVTFLLTVFGNDTKLGIIRSALAQFAPALTEKLEDAAIEPAPQPPQEGDLVLRSQHFTEAA